jgi:hypothetical protein
VTQTMHIVGKDLRRLQWLLVLWAGGLGARVALKTAGPILAGEGFGGAVVLQQLGGVVAILEMLMTALIAARLVHEEPLVSLNAFWLTRPYSRRSLLAAKLLLAGVALVVLPLAADVVTMSLFDAGPRAQLQAAPALAGGYLQWTLAFLVIAVLTPSTTVFAITIIGVMAALSAAMALLIMVAVFFAGESSSYTRSLVADPTPNVVGFVVFVLAALGVIVYQYRNRRWLPAASLAAVGAVAMIAVPSVWPWSLARTAEPDPGAWARDPSRTAAVLDRAEPPQVVQEPSFGRDAPPKRQIHARVRLSGLPADVAVRNVAARATLELPAGTTLQSEQMAGFQARLEIRVGESEAPRLPLEAALGGVRLLGAPEQGGFESWPGLLTLTEEEYTRHRGEAGRLDALLDFHLTRSQVVGTLPLAAGSAIDGTFFRIEVVGVRQQFDGILVAVRHWRTQPVLLPDPHGTYEFVLRNRMRAEALTGSQEPWGPSGAGTFGGSGLAVFPLVALGSAARGFVVQHEAQHFPGRRSRADAKRPQLDTAWLKDAELVVVENVYAGRVTRTLTAEDFPIPEP